MSLVHRNRKAWPSREPRVFLAPIRRRMSYRNDWYTIDDDPLILFAMGVHGQNLFVDRKNAMIIAKFSSRGERIDPRALMPTHASVAEFRYCNADEASA